MKSQEKSNTDKTAPTPTLEEARKPYEDQGLPHSSLELYRETWSSWETAREEEDDDDDDEEEKGIGGRLFSRHEASDHDRFLLEYLSSLFQDDDDTVIKGNDNEVKDEKTTIIKHLSSILDKYNNNPATASSSSPTTNNKNSTTLRHRIIRFNLALLKLSSGSASEAAQILCPVVHSILSGDDIDDSDDEEDADHHDDEYHEDDELMEEGEGNDGEDDVLSVREMTACRIMFFILDCLSSPYYVLATHEWKEGEEEDEKRALTIPPPLESILAWIDVHTDLWVRREKERQQQSTSTAGGERGGTTRRAGVIGSRGGSINQSATELRFRYHLYRSRYLLSPSTGEEEDNNKRMRTARKELKSAMEIYHHRIMPPKSASTTAAAGTEEDAGGGGSTRSGGGGKDAASVTSYDASDANNSQQNQREQSQNSQQLHQHQQQQQQAVATVASLGPMHRRRLEGQAQCALYLKANLERLKGNTRKSLKLCAEAKHAGEKKRLVEPRRIDAGKKGGEEEATATTTKASKSKTSEDDKQQDAILSQDHHQNLRTRLIDEAIHDNNLALLHQSSGRHHAAMHYYLRALSRIDSLTPSSCAVSYDGTVNPSPAPEIFHNASLCAFRIGRFLNSYECMLRCVRMSPDGFGKKSRCWLRMAEACLGIHAELRQKSNDYYGGYSIRPISGREGLIIDMNDETNHVKNKPSNTTAAFTNISSIILGSPQDINQVSTQPLLRARYCLQRSLTLCSQRRTTGTTSTTPPTTSATDFDHDDGDRDCFEASGVSLAYVWLELKEPMMALRLAQVVLNSSSNISENYHNKNKDLNLISQKRKATARLYACEALCAIGDPVAAEAVLRGMRDTDENNRPSSSSSSSSDAHLAALDRLAKNLAMVSNDEKGGDNDDTTPSPLERKRLEVAMSNVRTCASGASASKGDLVTAKNYALLALKDQIYGLDGVNGDDGSALGHSLMGGEVHVTSDTSLSARKALLYCLLRQGNQEESLALLRAAR